MQITKQWYNVATAQLFTLTKRLLRCPLFSGLNDLKVSPKLASLQLSNLEVTKSR